MDSESEKSNARELAWLTVRENRGQGNLPIPSPRDGEITRWVARLMNDGDLRPAVGESLTEAHGVTLRGYAERMASLAVRETSSERAGAGLTALALRVDATDDVRESILILPLLYDALVRIGASPDDVFQQVAKLKMGSGSHLLRSFLRRPPDKRSIETMGYRDGRDGDGFRYERIS